MWWIVLFVLAILFLLGWLWSLFPEIRLERARELFRLQHGRLENLFLDEVRKSGKPRGLHWVNCEFAGAVVFARERESRMIHALIPMQIQFEALPEGDMIDNPNVAEPRTGCAVFYFEEGGWFTQGKVLFNVSVAEAMQLFGAQYEEIKG